MSNKRIAVIRIRGDIKLNRSIKRTLQLLRLYKKNSCIIIKNTPNYVGMLNKVKDYVTWGELDEDTFKLLLTKRGKLVGKKPVSEDYLKDKIKTNSETFIREFMNCTKELVDVPGLKPFFKLNPPIKGYGRAGIKQPFSLGGALGYRKEKINDLIKRMI